MRVADLFSTRTLLGGCACPRWRCAASIESIRLCCSSFRCSPGRWGLQNHHMPVVGRFEKPKNALQYPGEQQLVILSSAGDDSTPVACVALLQAAQSSQRGTVWLHSSPPHPVQVGAGHRCFRRADDLHNNRRVFLVNGKHCIAVHQEPFPTKRNVHMINIM